jgi:phosphatidylglycerophosphate synthase
VIALREFLITGVRLFAASRHVVLAAAKEGKHKTVSQMGTIIVILTTLLVQEWMGEMLSDHAFTAMQGVVLGCLWIAMMLTVISGASFFWRHRAVLRDAISRS